MNQFKLIRAYHISDKMTDIKAKMEGKKLFSNHFEIGLQNHTKYKRGFICRSFNAKRLMENRWKYRVKPLFAKKRYDYWNCADAHPWE